MIDRVAVAFKGVVAESATCTIKLSVPDVVGVPEMAPVLGSSVSPGGRLPAATLHVYGGIPPVAPSVCKYPVPTMPLARLVVDISSVGVLPTTTVVLPDSIPPQVSAYVNVPEVTGVTTAEPV